MPVAGRRPRKGFTRVMMVIDIKEGMFRWDGVSRAQWASAIDAERGVACGEKADDLARGGESGIGIGFGRLRTELFWAWHSSDCPGRRDKFVVTIGRMSVR